MLQTASIILNNLSNNFTHKGLYDPIEKSTLPFKYGNSFFALSCGLLYKETKEEKWRTLAEKAAQIELQNTKNRFKKPEMFRWEFKNYALLKLLELNILSKNTTKKVRKRIATMQKLGSFNANWMAMRALNYAQRAKLLNKKSDLRRAKAEIKKVLQRQTAQGLFMDNAKSHSLQYHAYILALLLQYYQLYPSIVLRHKIRKGLDTLQILIDPKGDFNYFGRGQKQVFGYTSAIFALSYAHNKLDSNRGYAKSAKEVFEFIKPYLEEGKILANNNQKEKAGWYRYNYLTDYLPFSAAYLLLAHKEIKGHKIKKEQISEYELFLEDSNLFIKRTKEYFICLSTGNKSSSELPGLVHIYPHIIPSSGGPPINIKGKKPYTKNILGIGSSNFWKLKGKFKRTKESLDIIWKTKNFTLKQEWVLTNNIELKQTIYPKKKINIIPLHYIATKSIDKTKQTGQMLTPDGIANQYTHKKISITKPHTISLTIHQGKEKPTTPIAHYRSKSPKKSFTKQKILHFLSLGINKLTNNPKDFFYSPNLHVRKKQLQKKKVTL